MKLSLIERLIAGAVGLLPAPALQLLPVAQPSKHRPGKLGHGWMRGRMLAHIAEKNLERQARREKRGFLVGHLVRPPRDEHGAYTEVGRHPITGARRKWLAGVSAQRGY